MLEKTKFISTRMLAEPAGTELIHKGGKKMITDFFDTNKSMRNIILGVIMYLAVAFALAGAFYVLLYAVTDTGTKVLAIIIVAGLMIFDTTMAKCITLADVLKMVIIDICTLSIPVYVFMTLFMFCKL